MRTIRTKVYKFDELTPKAQNKAILGYIHLEIELSNRFGTNMQVCYSDEEKYNSVAKTIQANELEFYQDGTIYQH